MRYLGIDAALTCTGWAVLEPGVTPRFGAVSFPGRGAFRLNAGWRFIRGVLKELRPTFATIEGYAMHTKGPQFDTGELGGVFRLALFRAGVPYVVIPPATLKRYATGRGDADKAAMLEYARRTFQMAIRTADEADGLWLASVGRDWFEPQGPLPDPRPEILAGLDWPALMAPAP